MVLTSQNIIAIETLKWTNGTGNMIEGVYIISAEQDKSLHLYKMTFDEVNSQVNPAKLDADNLFNDIRHIAKHDTRPDTRNDKYVKLKIVRQTEQETMALLMTSKGKLEAVSNLF